MKKTFLTFVILLICITICCGCQAKNEASSSNIEEENSVLSLPAALMQKDYSMLSNKKIGWGFKKKKNEPPEVGSATRALFDKYGAVYMDKTPTKAIYLTFDEGYENGYTEKILDILSANSVKAAFFITAPYLKKNADLVDRMMREGHIVGNHSVNHPSLPDVTDVKKFEEELLGLDEAFFERYNKNMKYLRPPRGEFSERTLAMSKDLGYCNVFWSFAYVDWDTKKQKGAENAYHQITDGVHDGCILLLHAVSKDNAEVLGRVIIELKDRGYEFKSLDDLKI